MVKRLTAGRIWAIGYLVVVVGLVFSFYVDAQQDARQDASDVRAATSDARAAKAAAACIKKIVQVSTDSTSARSIAAEKRDTALVGSKKALRELIRLRIVEGINNSQQVQQAADQYLTQTDKFIRASEDLNKARAENPIPDPEAIC